MKKSVIGMLMAIVLTGGGLLLPGSGSAQATTDFDAAILGKIKKSEGGCADGARRCGQAVILEFGPAEYQFFLLSGAVIGSCVDYVGITTFTLEDGSTLTLDEVGRACGPGASFFSTPVHSWGNPDQVSGSWTVQAGTGQFDGMTGSGTQTMQSAGVKFSARYVGGLEQ